MRQILIGFVFSAGLALTAVADDRAPPPVETLMTPEDYTASGLDKLSAEEREHLSGWLERYRRGAIEGPPPKKTSEQLAEEKTEEIVAKVVPSFRGWSGKTLFKLDNGQVWQQRQVGKLRYNGDDSSIVIYRNMLGGYMLRHDDSGRSVGVKRIQ